MSELITAQNTERFCWRLLTTVSTLALISSINMRGAKAADEDTDRPTVWIELGGQLEHVSGQGAPFAPAFLAANPDSPVLQPTTPLQAQNPPPFSFAEEGKISLQPENSSWVFSASVNFGRSSNFKEVDHQTNRTIRTAYRNGAPVGQLLTSANFADTRVHHRESHAILDFSAGKDVGLGMFGRESSSVISAGVRFAQFSSKETLDIRARPDLKLKYYPSAHAPTRYIGPGFHSYHATGQSSRSFRGVGPSLSWNGSAPFAGNSQSGEIVFDWGANASILFGKQKARVQHLETGNYQSPAARIFGQGHIPIYQHFGEGHSGVHSIVVPNAGAFAGASYRVENFKVSLGYRADFFFGAIDGGVDARKSETLGFYGPFASVSVGIVG